MDAKKKTTKKKKNRYIVLDLRKLVVDQEEPRRAPISECSRQLGRPQILA
jgi:hypothetical protein